MLLKNKIVLRCEKGSGLGFARQTRLSLVAKSRGWIFVDVRAEALDEPELRTTEEYVIKGREREKRVKVTVTGRKSTKNWGEERGRRRIEERGL